MDERIKAYADKMEKSIESLERELAAIRAGRATPAVLDRITVDYYGTPTPINQMATVSVSEATNLLIQPWDRSTLKSIEKAIQASDLGINPTNDGSTIRLAFPKLTEERRKELTKQVRHMGEDFKVAIRNIRRTAMDDFKALKKKSEITEDDQKDLETELQKTTDKYTEKVDTCVAAKEKELLNV